MKRDPALVSLSRDHHQALVVAKQLRSATAETADDARTRYLAYWEAHGHEHFRLEEEILLPAFAAHGDPYDPRVARTLCDHVAIRQQADALVRNPDPTVAALQQLGRDLANHVRLEERELFPLIERAMPLSELAVVAARLETTGS